MNEMDHEQELGPETPEADAIEQRVAVDGEASADAPRPVPLDANEADAIEQRTPVREAFAGLPRQVPIDADEADAADQERPVELDDDDYR
jgi:hypothetical protein